MRSALSSLLVLLWLPWLPRPAVAQVQLRCEGTLLEARGAAELARPIRRLSFSLGLEAEGPGADGALASLQQRLAAVRTSLGQLQVEELRVSSPSTWERPVGRGRPAAVQASLQVSGRLAPERLQPLIRQVGALGGVRLGPVSAEADPARNAEVRRGLLQLAYRDALAQAAQVGEAIGRTRLRPLEVQIDASDLRPVAMRAKADVAPAVPPFDPAELELPKDRLTLLVRFCAG
jgi:uncharacterized protein YggE